MNDNARKSSEQANRDADELKPFFMPYRFRMRILDKLLTTYRQGYRDGLAHARELNKG